MYGETVNSAIKQITSAYPALSLESYVIMPNHILSADVYFIEGDAVIFMMWEMTIISLIVSKKQLLFAKKKCEKVKNTAMRDKKSKNY